MVLPILPEVGILVGLLGVEASPSAANLQRWLLFNKANILKKFGSSSGRTSATSFSPLVNYSGQPSSVLDKIWLKNSIQISTTSVSGCYSFSSASQFSQTPGFTGSNFCPITKPCKWTNSTRRPEETRVLLECIPGSEMGRGLSSHFQSLGLKSISSLSTLQNEDRAVRAAVRVGDWAVSLDLSDAYFRVHIHPVSLWYLRFALSQTGVHHFRVLPFGLSTAPLVFTRIVEAIAAFYRHRVCSFMSTWTIGFFTIKTIPSFRTDQLCSLLPAIVRLDDKFLSPT